MYVDPTFKTKKALKEAVASGRLVSVYSPGFGFPPQNGECSVEGPSYKPHSWCARVTIVNGYVAKVK